MTPHFRVPDLLNRYRRVRTDLRRAVLAFWSAQTVAGILLAAIAAANLALFLTATPRPPARALVSSFTEDFTTTTYRDAANTDGTWLGDGGAYLGFGSASSTRFFFENPSAGHAGFNGISCKDANTCYMTQGLLTGVGVYRTTDGGENWEMVYGCDGDSTHCDGNAQANGLYAVPGTDVVYVAGDDQNSGMVLKSTDGGTSWAAVNSGLPASTQFHNISCVDSTTCVVVGDNLSTTPRLYYTTNGTSWSVGTLPSGSYSLRGVDFINDGASTTWRAVGTNGKVIASKATSTPGGWTLETPFTGHTLRGVEHVSYGNILVAGGTNATDSFMATSTDDGTTYATSTHAMTRHIYDVECGDADTCWAVGGPTSGSPQQQRSDNGGVTWTLLSNNLSTFAGQLLAVSAVDGSTAWTAGGGNSAWILGRTSTSTQFDNMGVNRLCTPSGTCDSSFSGFPGRSIWLDPTDGQIGYMAGDNGGTGYVGKTYDGGLNWSMASSSNPGRINKIDCVTTSICFGGGVFGFLTTTVNGGTSWTTQTQTSVFDWNVSRIDAVTTQAVWVTGSTSGSTSKPRIVRSVNGGTTYAAATGTLSSSFVAHGLLALSTTTAWVGGRLEDGSNDPKLYYTTDGGASWTEQFTNAGEGFIYDVFCLPGNQTCWGLWNDSGGSDNIIKTTDGGSSWTASTDVIGDAGDQWSDIHFINDQVGFVAADNCTGSGDKFYTTVNGGASWMKRTFPCFRGSIAAYQNKLLVGGNQNSKSQVGRVVFAFDTTSTLQSTTIDSVSADIQCAGITPTQTLNGGTVTYEMTNDGGSTWTSSGGGCAGTSDTYEFAFSSTGSDLRWRATVTGLENSPPTTTPSITGVSINYVTNSVPNTPTNSSPADAATNVLLTPTLTASAFSDPDGGDTHDASRWEVSTVSGNYASPVYSTTSTTNLESVTIPSGTLANATTYYWHVKYVDQNGGNSAFSTETSFTTVAGGSLKGGLAPPESPEAVPEKTERASRSLLWRFQDNASDESGFSIVDVQNEDRAYASTNPIFTQDAFELKEGNLAPAVEHCNRAVVAFNDKGNSKITASSTYPCTWTLPDPPAALDVATSTPTTITLGGVAPDDNPAKVVYEICETTTGLCLAPGSAVSAADDGFVAAADDATYVLSKKGVQQTKEQWGKKIVVVGLMPETVYAFAATAYNPNGDAATGKDEKGETIVVEGETTAAPVKFSIVKEVAINPVQAALAGIGFAADFSFAALALMALAGMAWYLTLHRKSGSVRCAAGLCRIFAHHTRSYAATVADAEHGPPLSRHARVHGFTQGTLAAALGALALKGAVVGLGLFAPTGVFGQGEFTGDGVPVGVGDVIVYQIVVKNAGPSDATDVFLKDALPAQLEYVAGSLAIDGIKQTDACDLDWLCVIPGTVIMKRPALKLGEATAVTFSAKVTGKSGETVINAACVTAAQLTTPTCSDKTANPIGVIKQKFLNGNTNENQNVNVPALLNVNRALVNGNVNRPPPVTNANRNGNENQNVNVPVVEPPAAPPPFTESAKTNIKINEQAASAELIVADATPEISGTGEPGSLVAIRVDDALVGVVFVEADGTWSFVLRTPLVDGPHTVSVSLDGVVFDSARFVTDTRAPAPVSDLSITITNVDLAVSIRAALTGQAAGSDATIQVSGRTTPDTRLVRIRVESDPIEVSFVPPSTVWTREITGRFDPGEHLVTATAYDAAGNESASARKSFIVPEPAALETPLALLDNPAVERAAEISAPVIVGFAAVNVAVATGIPTLFNFLGLLLTQPALLFARKEKKGFGTVFNALSKLPIDLAIVRIRDRNTNRILQTKVTDRLGRYVFFLAPGAYAVEVTKGGYAHPSQLLAGKTDDVAYTDVLPSAALDAAEALRLAKNIPLDPVEDQKSPAAITRAVILRKVQYAFALTGPVLSGVTLLITPTLTILGLTVLQIAVFALFRRLAYKKPPKSFGIVRDEETGKPVSNAVVRIFETTYNKLLETQVTDARGRYAFLVGQSRYYVTAQAPGYATITTQPIDFSSVEKGGLVTRDVALRRA